MKKNIKLYLFSAVALLLTCSFTKSPVSPPEACPQEIIFSGEPLGGAHLVFAGKFGGEVSKKELEGQSELKVDGCAKGARVLKFTLDVTKSGITSSLQAESNMLNKDMLEELKSLTAGDSFAFRQVTARLLDTREVVNVTTNKFIVVDKRV